MNTLRIIIGVTNGKDIQILPSFLDYLESQKTIDHLLTIIFCQNIRLKKLLDGMKDKRIKYIIADSELHFTAKKNCHLKNRKDLLSENILTFLANSDRGISYEYFLLTRAIKKVLTNQDYAGHLPYVSYKFNLTYDILKKFNPHLGLAFTRDNGPSMYNYLFYGFKKMNLTLFFQHWLRVDGIVTINNSIFEIDEKTEKIFQKKNKNDLNQKIKSINYIKKYIRSNRNVIEGYYGEIIDEEKKLFFQFIKSTLQLWRLKYIIQQLIKYLSDQRIALFDRIDSLSIIIFNFRSWFYLKEFKSKFYNYDYNDRYIYYPLHAEPEVSTLVIGNKFLDQLALVKKLGQIAKRLDCKLFIKSHPYHYQVLPFKYIKELLSLDNVYCIDHRINSLDLINNADLTVTNSGTSALEACYIGKKSITLSKTIFSGFPNSPVKMLKNLTFGSLKEILEQPCSENNIKNKGANWIETAYDKSNFNLMANSWESLNLAKKDKDFRESYFQFIFHALEPVISKNLN